jgi:hypothetical protein
MTIVFLDPPAPIPLEPSPEDFLQRALHVRLVLSLAKERLEKLVVEAALNSNEVDGAELLRAIDAHLSDLGDDITGAFHQAADQLREDRYEGVSTRGPFVRVRR